MLWPVLYEGCSLLSVLLKCGNSTLGYVAVSFHFFLLSLSNMYCPPTVLDTPPFSPLLISQAGAESIHIGLID